MNVETNFFEDVRKEAEKTKVLLDRTAKEINALFRFFKNENEELPLELLKDLYIETKDNKVLIYSTTYYILFLKH